MITVKQHGSRVLQVTAESAHVEIIKEGDRVTILLQCIGNETQVVELFQLAAASAAMHVRRGENLTIEQVAPQGEPR